MSLLFQLLKLLLDVLQTLFDAPEHVFFGLQIVALLLVSLDDLNVGIHVLHPIVDPYGVLLDFGFVCSQQF